MKRIMILVFLFSIVTCVIAGDFQSVNDASVKAFLQIFPQYRELLEKYDQDVDFGQPVPAAIRHMGEIENLLSRFGMTLDDFMILTQKITAGFAREQMEQAGMGGMFHAMTAQMGDFLTSQEESVIKKYFSDIEAVLAE